MPAVGTSVHRGNNDTATMSGGTLAPRPPRREKAPGGNPRPSGRLIRAHAPGRSPREPLREGGGNGSGERRASGGPPSSSSSWHQRWAATSKRPSPPKAASHLEPDDDKENDDDRRPGKSSALVDRGGRAAFDFVAAVSSDARAFLARQKPTRRSSRAVSTSPESSSDAAPSRGGGRGTKRWNGSTILDPNAWPCAAPTDGRLHENLGENKPGKRDDDDDGCARQSDGRSNGRSNGRRSRSTRLTLVVAEARRAWSADADPRACAAGLGETESTTDRGIKNINREVNSREKDPGSRPTDGRAAPAWAVDRAEASHEHRRKSKSAHAGSRHAKRPDWNSDVSTDQAGARQGTPVRGLRQQVGEWRARCEALEVENESLREATRAALFGAKASEAEVRALIARVSALEGELERRRGRARDASSSSPAPAAVSGNGSDSTSPFSGDWSPPPVHASLAGSSVDDSPPARIAGFIARGGVTGNERGNFALSSEKGSPGSAGSLVGESHGAVSEPPSPVLFVLDDDDEEEEEEEEEGEAMFAADVDSVVDDLVAFAVEGAAEAFADDDRYDVRYDVRYDDETHVVTHDSPDDVTPVVRSTPTTLVPCAACADRAARLDAIVAEKDELVSAAAASAALANEYRARMHHARLDRDGDGYVGLDELLRHELFASYSQAVVERIHAFFPYGDRRKHGALDVDDFVKLTRWTEDRSTRDAQRFWFTIVDVDGDGVVGAHDVKWLYDSIWKGDAGTCVSLEDLVCQVADMAGAGCGNLSGGVRGGAGDATRRASTPPRFAPRPPGSAAARVPTRVPSQRPSARSVVGPDLADLRRCGLAPGVFGLLLNHGDMLLRRSTAEFSDRDVPM